MNKLVNILIVIGLLLLVAAGVGRIIGRPQTFIGVKVISLIVLANSALLLAILAKLSIKK